MNADESTSSTVRRLAERTFGALGIEVDMVQADGPHDEPWLFGILIPTNASARNLRLLRSLAKYLHIDGNDLPQAKDLRAFSHGKYKAYALLICPEPRSASLYSTTVCSLAHRLRSVHDISRWLHEDVHLVSFRATLTPLEAWHPLMSFGIRAAPRMFEDLIDFRLSFRFRRILALRGAIRGLSNIGFRTAQVRLDLLRGTLRNADWPIWGHSSLGEFEIDKGRKVRTSISLAMPIGEVGIGTDSPSDKVRWKTEIPEIEMAWEDTRVDWEIGDGGTGRALFGNLTTLLEVIPHQGIASGTISMEVAKLKGKPMVDWNLRQEFSYRRTEQGLLLSADY